MTWSIDSGVTDKPHQVDAFANVESTNNEEELH